MNVTHLATQARHLAIILDAFLSLPALFPPIPKRSSMDILNYPHFRFSSLKHLPFCIDDCSNHGGYRSHGWLPPGWGPPVPFAYGYWATSDILPGSPALQQKAASQAAPCACLGTHTWYIKSRMAGSSLGLCLCRLLPSDHLSFSLLNATFVPQVRGHLFWEVFPDL